MKFIKEFKEFAIKGNLVDMAIAFVIGGAFAKVVSSFIEGLVMPVVGKITSGVDFRSLKYILSEAVLEPAGKVLKPEAAIKYGEFITIVIDFFLVAFFMFIVIKAMNKLKRKQAEEVPPTPVLTADQQLLTEIRDLLKSKNE